VEAGSNAAADSAAARSGLSIFDIENDFQKYVKRVRSDGSDTIGRPFS
jgi:hypothetical protein